MGSAMARRIRAAGFPLKVYNRNATKASQFASEGFTVAKSPAEAVVGSEIIYVWFRMIKHRKLCGLVRQEL